jgi:hypothetical protein
MTVIEIRAFRNRWKSYEGSGVEPVFGTKEEAIGYAQVRACFRSGEIRIVDSGERIERVMSLPPISEHPILDKFTR